MAQLNARPTGDQEGASSTPPGRQHSFVETEIFSTVIFLSTDSRRAVVSLCTILTNRLED